MSVRLSVRPSENKLIVAWLGFVLLVFVTLGVDGLLLAANSTLQPRLVLVAHLFIRRRGVFRPGRASKKRIFMLSRQYFQGIFWVVFPGFFPLGIPKVQRVLNLVDLEKC